MHQVIAMADTALSGIYRYRPVDDSLITSGQPTVEQLATIAAAGFTTLINLGLHDDPRYSLPDEAGSARSVGLHYVHIPAPFEAPTEAALLAFFNTLDEHTGEKIWVHCASNLRVAVFLALHRMIRLGWSRERAFEQLNSHWVPDGTWSAFIEAMLAKYAA